MANADFDAISFVKALHDKLVGGNGGTSATSSSGTPAQTQGGEKRSREESNSTDQEAQGDRDSTGRFMNNNKAAKRGKETSVADAIKAINVIYSESNKAPEALKHQLAQQVCQSYGMNIDASIFSSSSSSSTSSSSSSNDAGAAEEEQTPPEGEGEEEEGEGEGDAASSEPKESAPQLEQPPSRFDINAYSAEDIGNALAFAFNAQQSQASKVTGNSGAGDNTNV